MKTVRILIKDGCIIDAKGDEGVELVIYDLDCDYADQVELEWNQDTTNMNEIEIL